jgi:hypothetical protein
MGQITWAASLLIFLAVPALAQQTNTQQQGTQSGKAVEPPRKSRSANLPACDQLTRLGLVMDRLTGNPVDEILAAIDGVGQNPDPPALDGETDPVWNELMDCANQTHSESERAEAWRVAAMWEGWRAEQFRKMYRKAEPTPVAECKGLEKLDAQTKAISPTKEDLDTYRLPGSFNQIVTSLAECRDAARRVSPSKPHPQFVLAEEDLAMLNHAWHVDQENRTLAEANAVVSDYNRLVGAHNELVERLKRNERLDRAYIDSLEATILMQSLSPRQTSCVGTFYNYGTWGAATSTCQ